MDYRINISCSNCGKEIKRQKSKVNPITNLCRSCSTIANNKNRSIKICRACGISLTEETRYLAGKKRISTFALCKNCKKESDSRKRFLIKSMVMKHYGGICACCGESEIKFLTLDHINNDGNFHRMSLNSVGDKLYQKLVRDNFNSEYAFQILCWNCNEAKQNYEVCPHKERKNDRAI